MKNSDTIWFLILAIIVEAIVARLITDDYFLLVWGLFVGATLATVLKK